jgi:hypothetical protein
MQFRLQPLLVFGAVAPPALAWIWANLALITPLIPLLSLAALGAGIVTLVILDGDDQ